MSKLTTKITAAAIGATVLLSGIGSASAATYTVKKGDTLSKIGREHNLTYQQIMKDNNLSSANIKVGQKLQIGAKVATATTPAKVSTPAKTTTATTAAKATSTYTVKKGDSLSKIASMYGVSYKTLMTWNNLSSTNLKVGQKLSVKGQVKTASVSKVSAPAANSYGNKVVNIAYKYNGIRYAFGGTSPRTGFDCSGYVSYVFKEAGILGSRLTAAGLYSASKKVSTPQVGDLVFYSGTYKAGISHVGIYIGNNQMINASGSRVQVTNIYNSYWKNYFTGFGRL